VTVEVRTSRWDTARVLMGVLAPVAAQGVNVRRRRIVTMAHWPDSDRRSGVDRWLEPDHHDPALIPFSAGPVQRPGRDLPGTLNYAAITVGISRFDADGIQDGHG
jgi:hypothetical protein